MLGSSLNTMQILHHKGEHAEAHANRLLQTQDKIEHSLSCSLKDAVLPKVQIHAAFPQRDIPTVRNRYVT